MEEELWLYWLCPLYWLRPPLAKINNQGIECGLPGSPWLSKTGLSCWPVFFQFLISLSICPPMYGLCMCLVTRSFISKTLTFSSFMGIKTSNCVETIHFWPMLSIQNLLHSLRPFKQGTTQVCTPNFLFSCVGTVHQLFGAVGGTFKNVRLDQKFFCDLRIPQGSNG